MKQLLFPQIFKSAFDAHFPCPSILSDTRYHTDLKMAWTKVSAAFFIPWLLSSSKQHSLPTSLGLENTFQIPATAVTAPRNGGEVAGPPLCAWGRVFTRGRPWRFRHRSSFKLVRKKSRKESCGLIPSCQLGQVPYCAPLERSSLWLGFVATKPCSTHGSVWFPWEEDFKHGFFKNLNFERENLSLFAVVG